MPQPPDWKRVLETGMQFTELRRSQAHRLASDLVAQGQLARDQVGAAVDELMEISRRRSEELRAIVSTEVQRQLGLIGFATKRDLEDLERRLLGSTSARKATAAKAPGTKKPAKTATARKTPAAKPVEGKAPAKRALAKASTRTVAAKRSTVKRTVRKSTVTRAD